MQLLYRLAFAGSGEETNAAARFWEDNAGLSDEVRSYAALLADRVVAHRAALDCMIADVTEKWELDRVAPVERNILRIALAEIFYGSDVPPKVAMDEAIEIAKGYGSGARSADFVNGILDAVYKRHVRAA